MAKGKRLKEYDQHYYDNANSGQPVVLAKKGGGCVSKLIISLVVTVVVLGLLIGGGLLVGNYFCQDRLGVSLWTVFEVLGDVRYDKDADKIVTNAYSDSDVDGFYYALGGTIFLNESANTRVIMSDAVGRMLSGGEFESVGEELSKLFTINNIDMDKLAAYSGWKTGEDPSSRFTDRQLAAFLNDVIISSLDSSAGELPFGISLDGSLVIDQVIIQRGRDMLPEDKDYLGAKDDNVYMTLTASVRLHAIADQVMDEMGMGGFGWLVKWMLPENMYFSMTVDMNDPAYADEALTDPVPKYEINRLGRYTCSYKGVNDSEPAQMSKMDRLLAVIDTISENLGSDPASGAIDDVLSGLAPFIAESNAEFSLGSMIRFDTVQSGSGGHFFEMDFFGTVMDSLASGSAVTASDVAVLMQTVIIASENTEDIISRAAGAAVHGNAVKANVNAAAAVKASGYRFYEPEGYENIPDEHRTLIDAYGIDFFVALAEAYGVEIYADDTAEEKELLYTIDDLYGALGLSDVISETAQELREKIDKSVEAVQAAHESDPYVNPMPSIALTDRMVCALLYSQMSGTGGELEEYGIVFEKLAIEKRDIDGTEHSFARIYCTFSFDDLLGDGDTVTELMSGFVSGRPMLIEITLDVSLDLPDGIDKAGPVININGLYGDSGYLNGLDTSYVLGIIQRISSFSTESLMTELDKNINDALADIRGDADNKASLLVGAYFVESAAV